MNKIHILNNHHDNKTTIVVGEFCINGCQIFNKNQYKDVFEKHQVLEKHQRDVIELFEKYKPNEPFDLEDLKNLHKRLDPPIGWDVFISDESYETDDFIDNSQYQNIFTILLKNYNTPELLDFMFSNEDKILTLMGIGYFSTEQKDQLVLGDNVRFRKELARLGEREYLNKLVYDKDSKVREEVAKHGIKEHLDILVHDKSYEVRQCVAKFGFKEHLDILVRDKADWVRVAVAKFGWEEHHNELVYDESDGVRIAVAIYGQDKHRNILAYDLTDWLVFSSLINDEE